MFSSRSDLLRTLPKNEGYASYEADDVTHLFYLISCEPALCFRGPKLNIALSGPDHGLRPELLSVLDESMLFIGFDYRIVAVNLRSGQVAFDRDLTSLFHSFARVPGKSPIILFLETGAAAMNTSGAMLWDRGNDLLTDALLTGSKLQLSFADAPSLSVDANDGRVSA